MQRNLQQLGGTQHDVLVIGGGIYGASIAREAALRGLRVGLVEAEDFGHATSSNSLRVIHGGFRYLQHLDVLRMRASISERKNLMCIAPHLVHPIDFLMPTYRHGLHCKTLMRAALLMNDLVGWDRNRGIDADKRLPPGRILNREECKRIIPELTGEDVTGAAVWPDCQLHNSERFLIGIVHAAVAAGAQAANYVRVTGFLEEGSRMVGVRAVDQLSGNPLEIRAGFVVNAAGPWVEEVLDKAKTRPRRSPMRFSKAMNLVVKRPLATGCAVGFPSKRTYVDPHAAINKGNRFYFMLPWRQFTLIGTTHLPSEDAPDRAQPTDDEIDAFIDEINEALPTARLTRQSVFQVHWGLLPMNPPAGAQQDVSLLKRCRIYDHAREDGIQGLISVAGVKLTEARRVAEDVVDLVCARVGGTWGPSRSSTTPIDGGETGPFRVFLSREMAKRPGGLGAEVLHHLLHNYGSAYERVTRYLDGGLGLEGLVTQDAPVLAAEVVHAVREEMAFRLSDVVRRRTDLSLFVEPGSAGIDRCAQIMGRELGWDAARTRAEIESVRVASALVA